ncbi:MAG: hypothetical protein U5M51_12720 [Emticicia sp.]|nr:hypothetical protein [Emticicia sp.]
MTKSGNNDWGIVTTLMKKLFGIELLKPLFNVSRGHCGVIAYGSGHIIQNSLDISV